MNVEWIKYLPAFIKLRLEGRHDLQKVISNTGWLLSDKILRMGVGLFVGVWLARYLSAEQFGQLNYATAFVEIFGAIAGMGLNGIVVRDIVRGHYDVNTTLGTAFVLQVVGGLISIVLIIGTIIWLRPDDAFTKFMVAILSLSLIFKSTEVVKYWFESQVQSHHVVLIENGVFSLMACIKVALILQHASLIAFVWFTLVETVLVAIGLLVIYAKRGGCLRSWKSTAIRTKSLLRDSWPLIVSGIAIIIYMRIDQIMLGDMLGNEAVGIYSAAVRISEIWYFIPMAIVVSVFPAIIDAKKQSESLYYERLQQLYDFMTLMSLCVAVLITFMADPLINILYGRNYSRASGVLVIHTWAGVFVALGVARGKWLLVENLNKFSFLYTGFGAITNMLGNYILIPKFGVNGAAFATVISYGISVLFAPALFKQTRLSSLQLIKSFNLVRVYCNAKKNF